MLTTVSLELFAHNVIIRTVGKMLISTTGAQVFRWQAHIRVLHVNRVIQIMYIKARQRIAIPATLPGINIMVNSERIAVPATSRPNGQM